MIKKYFLPSMLCILIFVSCGPNFKEAQDFYDEKKYDDALTVLRRLVRDNPDHFEAHEMMGQIYVMKKNLINAIYHYKKCLKVKPKHFETNLTLGNLLIQAKKYSEGTEVLEGIRERIQQDKEALNNLGKGYLYTGKFQESQNELQKVLTMAPDFTDVHLNLGVLAYKMRNYTEAKSTLDNALKLDNENAEVHFWLARTYGKLGDNEKMEESFRTTINLNPSMEEAHLHLGKYLMEQGNYGDAAEVFGDLLYYIEDSVEGMKYLAIVQEKLNWPVYRRNNGRTSGFGKSINPPCRIKWETWVGKDLRYAPITIGSDIFVVEKDRVIGLKPKTGKQQWVRPLDSVVVAEPVAIVPNLFVCEKTKLTCLIIKNGSLLWEYATGGEINVSPIYYKKKILVIKNIQKEGAGGIVVDLLGSSKGNLVSTFPINNDPDSRCISAAVHEDYLYSVILTGSNASLSAIDLYSGENIWTTDIQGCAGEPCYSDAAIFISSTGKNILAYDLNSGDQFWEKVLDGDLQSNFIWSNYTLFAACGIPEGKTALFALQDDSGEIMWSFEPEGKGTGLKSGQGYLSISENRLLWLSSSGEIRIIDSTEGKQVWKYLPPSPSISVASLLDRKFFMNTKDGFVYAFEHGEPKSEKQQKTAAGNIKNRILEGKKDLAKNVKGTLLAFTVQIKMVVNNYGQWTGGLDLIIKNDNKFPLTNVQLSIDRNYKYTNSVDSTGKSLKFVDIAKTFTVNTLQFVTSQGAKFPVQGKPNTIKIITDQGQGFTKLTW